MPRDLLDPIPGVAAVAEDVDVFPASYAQARFWLLERVAPRGAYTVPWEFRILGDLDATRLQGAIDQVVARHESLRTTFVLEGAAPVQRVHSALPVVLLLDDLSTLPTGAAAIAADELARSDVARSFDLSVGPLVRARLIRLADREHRFCLTLHHIIVDEWSWEILLREIRECYDALTDGRRADLATLPIQYADYAVWQREWIESGGARDDSEWWLKRLQPPLPVLDLPFDHPRPPSVAQPGAYASFTVPAGTARDILALARAHQTTPFITCLAAYAVFLLRHTGQRDMIIGTPVTDRGRPETHGLIGFFLNMLALRFELTRELSFDELIVMTRSLVLEAMQHQDLPFDHLVEALHPERQLGRPPVFQTSFVYVVARENGFALNGLHVESLPPHQPNAARFDLSLFLSERDGDLTGTFEYRSDLFDADTITGMTERFTTLLQELTQAPQRSVDRASILSAAERTLVLETWNQSARGSDHETTLHALVARQVDATPDRVAVRAVEGEWTYGELDAQAGRIAGLLRARGVGPGSLVGVCMDRSLGLVASVLGVLQSGAAYVPIDTVYPPARITSMLADARVTLLLTGPGTPEALVDAQWELLPWDAAPAATTAANVPAQAGPRDPAYVVFTSGSTGRPKGTVIPHSALVNYMDWMQTEFPLTRNDAVLQRTSISFDISVWEFWAPLVVGARLIMAPPGHHENPAALIATLRSERITILQLVPTMLGGLLNAGGLDGVTSLRLVFCIGEALTWDLVAAFRRHHSPQLVNLYGPTEATIAATFWVADTDQGTGPVPIGRPIANTQLYVLDPQGEPTAIGVPGELHIAGDGVAHGYLHRPDLTAERFLVNRFRPGSGGIMYRTGDLVRYRRDGVLEYLGRLDDQVKLRGFRIELGEIEATLCTVPAVSSAAVTLQMASNGDKRLVAHVEALPGSSLDLIQLRRALKQRLPDYMIPATILVVARMPLLPSGKIDRAALIRSADEPALLPSQSAAEVGAGTTLELTLQAIWKRILGVPGVGLDDDFFEIGGHSLLAARMVDELERDTGYRLPLAMLFEVSTIRTLIPRLLTDAYPQQAPRIREVQRGAAGRTPFFMLTGDLTGGGFYCRGVAAALDADQPLYAITPATPDTAAPRTTVEGMAAAHLEDVRRIQQAGPYRLGGYCVGGLVAYEMARQLRTEGEEVELLLLVDPGDPGAHGWLAHHLAQVASRMTTYDDSAQLSRLAYLKQRTRSITAMPWSRRLATVAAYPVRLARRYFRRPAATLPTAGADAASGTPASSSNARTMEHHSRAQHAYRHHRYAARTDILVSAHDGRPPGEQLAAWQRIAPASVLHQSSAGHSEVVFTHLPQLLRDQLDRVERERSSGR
jgi:amino acid adenylation domain-containing protein